MHTSMHDTYPLESRPDLCSDLPDKLELKGKMRTSARNVLIQQSIVNGPSEKSFFPFLSL